MRHRLILGAALFAAGCLHGPVNNYPDGGQLVCDHGEACGIGTHCFEGFCVLDDPDASGPADAGSRPDGGADSGATAPENLRYDTNPAVYIRGTTITPNNPSSTGGAVASYAVSPALPTGLRLDNSTGIISGTPAVLSPAASYAVTAANAGGSVTLDVDIAVIDVAPVGLAYSPNPATYTKGVAITPNVPSSSGGAVISYSVTPALPAGLSLDTTAGGISGMPTAVAAAASYAVTATNTGGSSTAHLYITVNDIPPSGLAYSANPAVYNWGAAIASNVPSSSGGAVVSYSVSPALPAGLNLDASTGVMSGTPTATAATASYTVTAANSGGSTTAGLSVAVKDTVVAIAAGYQHSCALVNGGVQCWGWNAFGQLGNNSTNSSRVPVKVTGSMGGVTVIAAGGRHTCALVNSGAQCWGLNQFGELGDNSATSSPVPVQVTGLASGVTAVAAGAYHTCAVVNGSAECWGANDKGQLGDSSTTSSPVPVQVTGLASGVTAIAAGSQHTCALVNGAVLCWGRNTSGQLGNNSTADSLVPVPVFGLSGVTIVTGNFDHTCALSSGAVQCWGDNAFGQLGNNSQANSSVPVQIPALMTGVVAVTANGGQTCAVVNGGAQCWGNNSAGQLGNNSTTGSLVPIQVTGLASLSGAQAVTTGGSHTCALANGSVQCWGWNVDGQLGNNSTVNSLVPVSVSAWVP
jgi:alpha-tubulin suppressor-like RCC1 family protein